MIGNVAVFLHGIHPMFPSKIDVFHEFSNNLLAVNV